MVYSTEYRFNECGTVTWIGRSSNILCVFIIIWNVGLSQSCFVYFMFAHLLQQIHSSQDHLLDQQHIIFLWLRYILIVVECPRR